MSLPQIRLYTLIQKHEDPYSFAQDAMHLMRNGKLVLKVRGASSARELIIMFNRVKQRPGNANQMANEEANLLNILSEVSTVDKSIKPGITAAHLKLPPALSFKTRQVKAKQATGGPFGGESFPAYTIWEIDDHKHLLTRNQETLLRNAGWVSYQGVWTKDQIVRSSTQKEEFVDIVKGWSESEEIFLNPKPNEIRDILTVLKSAGGDVVRAFIDSKKVYMWAGKAVIHNAVADMLHIPNSMIPVYLAFGKNGQKIERVSLSGRALSARDTKLSERDLTIIGKNKWINLRLDDHATFSSPSDLDTIFVGPKLQPYKEFLRRPIGEEFVDIVKSGFVSDEVYKNPTSREMRDISKVSYLDKVSGTSLLRAFVFPKDVYVWAGAVMHPDVMFDLHLPHNGLEVYVMVPQGKTAFTQIRLSPSIVVPKEQRHPLLLSIATHPKFKPFITPKTTFLDPFSDNKEYTTKDLVNKSVNEEFVDFVLSAKAKESFYKNPTSREMKEIMDEGEESGNMVSGTDMMIRGLIYKKDIYAWAGNVLHDTVKRQRSLPNDGDEVYFFLKRGQTRMYKVKVSSSVPTGKDELPRLKGYVKHPRLTTFITPDTEFHSTYAKKPIRSTAKELSEEFMDFVGQKREEIYKNPTTREFGDILNRTWATFARGGLRAIVDKKDVYVWAGNYMHGDVRDTLPRGTLSTAAKELYLDVEKGKSTISEVHLSITYFRHVSTTEARNTVNALTNHPWIKKYITPETQLNDGFVLIPVKDIQ